MRKSFCDRCGKEANNLKQLKICYGVPSRYGNYEEVCIEICEDCQKETGVFDFIKEHKYEEKPLEQSTQDKFFELFRDLVAESVQGMQ